MAKAGSPLGWLLLDGYDLTGAKPKTITLSIMETSEKATGIGDTNDDNLPVGVQASTFTQDGAFFDTAQNSIHDAFATKLPTGPSAAARVLCMGVFGQVLGAIFYGLANAVSVGYNVVVNAGSLTKANAKYAVSARAERGLIVQPLATKTADWDTSATPTDFTADPSQVAIPIVSNTQANPSQVTTAVPHGLTTGDVVLISGNTGSSPAINGQRTVTVIDALNFTVAVDTSAGAGGTGGQFVRASSRNGGAGYQQVTAFAGFTGYVGKLRHSPDNVTYADLCTFANVTAGPTADREVINGVINRYVDHAGDVTGAGSLGVFSGVTRN